MTLTCSGCGAEIESNTKYLCVLRSNHGDFEVQVGCEHRQPPMVDAYFEAPSTSRIMIFGGSNCFHKWLEFWERSIGRCTDDDR